MKTITSKISAELFALLQKESIKAGDIFFTLIINRDPILLIRKVNSPIAFSFGWDKTEKHCLFSLN